MEKSMNMTINRLPAITWNRLKMNEAFVPDVKIPVAGTYEEQLGKHAGINLGSGLELHQADENEKQLFDSIETALGKDMDKLGENFPVEVIQCTDEKNPEAGSQAIFNLTSDGRYGRYFLYVKANTRMNAAVFCTSKGKRSRALLPAAENLRGGERTTGSDRCADHGQKNKSIFRYRRNPGAKTLP